MTELPGRPGSLWTRADLPAYPSLQEDTEADVAVVGGGMAGVCTAWEAARAGRSVVLVEARRLGSGVTGHTTAKLSALQGLLYHHLRTAIGPEAARQYATSQTEAVEHAAWAIGELGIDCGWERVDAHTYATRPESEEELRAEAHAAREAGLAAEYVTGGLPLDAHGAVRLADQAQFHPLQFLAGLADDLVAHGGRIHEGTRVTGLHEGSPCRLTTEQGCAVRARDVVVATHYPVFDRTLLFPRMTSHRELVVTGLIPTSDAPQGMYLTPEDRTRSLRTAPYDDEHRLLIVTGEKFGPGEGGVRGRYERLASWMLRHFPTARPTHRWAAQDNWTSDRVPFVGPGHAAARHVYVATGFGGWGLTGSLMAGRLLNSLIVGGDTAGQPPWAQLYDPRRFHMRREGHALLEQQSHTLRHFVGDRLTSAEPAATADIAPGEGAVIRDGLHHEAVHRSADGKVHAVNARCTHLGCLVQFNDAEQTWECPCHGSRFTPDGDVLQGPAVHPLKKVEKEQDTPPP